MVEQGLSTAPAIKTVPGVSSLPLHVIVAGGGAVFNSMTTRPGSCSVDCEEIR